MRFRLWAPRAARAEVAIESGSRQPMARDARGIFEAVVASAGPGTRYRYQLDGAKVPDPASRYQPEGVHGPSEVVSLAFSWRDDDWRGIRRNELVFYELHVGTFTREGTFASARERLTDLAELGVTAIELMPVHDFPGGRNWGYDPAAFYAPARCYGRPEELAAFVDEAHSLGIAVFLDVVYNHTGPDGAYVAGLGPLFNDRHHTAWGQAINLDGEGSAPVRGFLLENALYWLEAYHMDGLRLDATFALVDDGPVHFLAELAAAAGELPGPRRILVAEDHLNDRRNLDPREEGGHGLDAVWSDDFHHLVRRMATKDRHGYFRPFPASPAAIGHAVEKGWFLTGEPHGTDPAGLEPDRFVFCIQNHDQVGNRPAGGRLHHAIDLSLYRALSSLLLFAPELPLLFMGQEWAASTPFLYFTDHHEELGRAVSEGRRREFRDFPGFAGEVPDPQDPETFDRSVLQWEEREREPHAGMLRLYRDLLAHRRRGVRLDDGRVEALAGPARAEALEDVLILRRGRLALLVAFTGGVEVSLETARPIWNSEEGYAEPPEPPEIVAPEGVTGERRVRFPVPAALLLEEPGD